MSDLAPQSQGIIRSGGGGLLSPHYVIRLDIRKGNTQAPYTWVSTDINKQKIKQPEGVIIYSFLPHQTSPSWPRCSCGRGSRDDISSTAANIEHWHMRLNVKQPK